MKNFKAQKLSILFAPLPTAIIGIYTMYFFDISIQFWLLNLVCVCLFTIVAILYSRKVILPQKNNPYVILSISTTLLLCTFIGIGIENVHRWLNLSSFQLNIGLLITPLILIQISKVNNILHCILFAILINITFVLQPDASLVTAFSLASFFIIQNKTHNKPIIISLFLYSSFLIIYSWYNLDSLEPVRYVEGILEMAKNISPLLYLASIIALFLTVLPFIVIYPKKDNISLALGIYFSLLIISSFFGNFPVIIMGYGFAPIIGYYIGLIWKINNLEKTN